MFNDMFKKDFIEATSMKARRKLRKMHIKPYLDAVLQRGLSRKEPRENACYGRGPRCTGGHLHKVLQASSTHRAD